MQVTPMYVDIIETEFPPLTWGYEYTIRVGGSSMLATCPMYVATSN